MVSKEFKKGIAIGLLLSYFMISPILSAVSLGSLTTLVIIIIAAYLYFIAK